MLYGVRACVLRAACVACVLRGVCCVLPVCVGDLRAVWCVAVRTVAACGADQHVRGSLISVCVDR